MSDLLYVGVRGSVLAYEKSTGRQVWVTPLKNTTPVHNSCFVNLIVDNDKVFVHTGGELFALNASTGELLWRDELSGFGYGIATLAVAGGSGNAQTAEAQRIFEEER